jgi:hypothetical protein
MKRVRFLDIIQANRAASLRILYTEHSWKNGRESWQIVVPGKALVRCRTTNSDVCVQLVSIEQTSQNVPSSSYMDFMYLAQPHDRTNARDA